MSWPVTWGVTKKELSRPFPCDRVLTGINCEWWRGVSVDAPPEIIFRWLCQLKVAPYSYDWIDNRGHKSPEQLTPGLDSLSVGDEIMGLFRVVEFEPPRQITLAAITNPQAGEPTADAGIWSRFIRACAVTYMIVPDQESPGRCRLLGKIVVVYSPGIIGWLSKVFLSWGDLIMMRKQLLNLKRLAERDSAAKSGAAERI